MPNLATTYLGLPLKNPLVASASPLSKQVQLVERLEEAGAAAVVMYSLFEEQITHESHVLHAALEHAAHAHGEALTYLPEPAVLQLSPDLYLEQVARLKRATSIPIIGSLNGLSLGGWVTYARAIEQAGADAIELNIYSLPTDPHVTGAELEEQYVQLVQAVRAQVTIPVAVKLSPFFTSLPNMALRYAAAGADGLVLFNRFYQPDLDLDTLEVVSRLTLSSSRDLHLPLRWIAILHGRVPVDFALTSGVHSAVDVLKALMAGARVAMLASELLANGIPRLRTILADLQQWLTDHEYESVAQLQGSMSQQAVADPASFERASYVDIVDGRVQWLP